MELPIAFAERMKQLLGAEYDAFLHALTEEHEVKGLRVNTHKISVECFEENAPFPLEKIPYAVGGFVIGEDVGAGKHPYHHAGAYYMQDPGAMATVAAVPRELFGGEGLRVLDLCAAPGGKTTQLAALCEARGGVVLANEYVSSRARILAGNVERMGLSNVCVTNVDTARIGEWYPSFFDLVVVDAPCSGEGMFRKNVPAIEEWSLDNVRMCAERQREILENGARTVSPGGYLLYSTCTYSTEENEGMVLDFLKRHPDFSVCECDASLADFTADGIVLEVGYALERCRRFYPHRARGEGQFVALLRRDRDAVASGRVCADARSVPDKRDRAVAEEFLRETLGKTLDGLCVLGGNITLFSRDYGLPLPPFGVVAAGCVIGEVRKGRLIPHHHFFMAYGRDFLSRVCLKPEDERVRRYLLGEEIGGENMRSYTALLLSVGEELIPLGGGKASDGRLKNYYPKGLRVK